VTRTLDFPCRITNGRIPEATAKQIAVAVRALDGKQVVLSFREAKRARSLNQNAWYWSGVIPPIVALFRENGSMVDADDVHEFLKEHVGKLKQNVVTPDGEVVKVLGSTAKLSRTEFSDYVERIRAWAAEFGVAIPSPDEQASQLTKEGEATE